MNDTFQQISLVGFMKHNGGLEFRTISESDYQFRARIQDFHLNPGGITHGGFIMSLMDSGMGTAAHRTLAKDARAATISFLNTSEAGRSPLFRMVIPTSAGKAFLNIVVNRFNSAECL